MISRNICILIRYGIILSNQQLDMLQIFIGSIPTFAAGLATNSTMTDDTAVGTTLLTVVATDPGDTLNLTLQSTTPASTAINFDPATGCMSVRPYVLV